MKTVIVAGGKEGSILYDHKNKEALISHPDNEVSSRINRYLNTERKFTVSDNNDPGIVGSRRQVSAVPTHDIHFFDMALNEMMAHTGVKVDWGKSDWGNAPKIVKSIDGEEFEII